MIIMRLTLFITVLCISVIATQGDRGNRGDRGDRGSSRRPWGRRHHNVTTTQNRPSSCPAIECPDQHGICPYGPNQDENLCTLCGCRASRRCGARPMCMMHCPDGFENGPDGCPTCRCYIAPPTPALLVAQSAERTAPAAAACTLNLLTCNTTCEHGRELDESGCETCECRQPGRPRGRFQHRHRHQHQHHQSQEPSVGHHRQPQEPSVGHHARTKTFNRTAAGTPSVGQLPAGNQTLPSTCPPQCLMFCEHGFKRDDSGCPLCECNDVAVLRRNSPECIRPACAMFCEDGYRTDSRGCTICQCFQPGSSAGVVASSQQCPQLRCHRSRRCAFGFEVDRTTGCQSCICRQSSGA